ncbi:MAG: polyprenyl synthetase family protein [Planctomycetota bacterium]
MTRTSKLAGGVPPTRSLRLRIREALEAHADDHPELAHADLTGMRGAVGEVLQQLDCCRCYTDWGCVLLNNALWREQGAAVPFDKRLLLLPKCLRDTSRCTASMDQLGLICGGCGGCSLMGLQARAEELGYAVLVAEGSAVAMEIIRNRAIEAIVGVSCLSVLERAFAHMRLAGMPGLAIPLLTDTCRDSKADLDWVWDVIESRSDQTRHRLDLQRVRDDLRELFTRERVAELLGPTRNSGEAAARDFLCDGGKRWRPLLTVATARACAPDEDFPEDLQGLALAVECFHKASLVHDDIEDDDLERDGRSCLHRQIGTAAAINAGDYLLGEGYRLLTMLRHQRSPDILAMAAQSHRDLCAGQGLELSWREGREPGVDDFIASFRDKTAPAFGVGIGLGAHYARLPISAFPAIARFAEHLGIAYQLRDDRLDLAAHRGGGDLRRDRPCLMLALLRQAADAAQWRQVEHWRTGGPVEPVLELAERYHIGHEIGLMETGHRQAARDAVLELRDASLRTLLLRITTRIFGDVCLDGWGCH